MVAPEQIQDKRITLTGEDHKHLSQVLRLGPGDIIGVFDGSGMEYEARLIKVDKAEALAEILSSRLSDTEPRLRVTLLQGIPKGEKMDWIVQKAVELGVYQVIPVITQHTVVKLDQKERQKKAERWNRIAREAAKQCKRAFVPQVLTPVSLDEMLKLRDNYDAAVLLYENEQKKCLKELMICYTINKIGDIALFVGPEGGFSSLEVDKCFQNGFAVAGLGKRILRSETAAISGLSIIMYEMGEMQ
jgi:16S rRNA (uracil1498-N3)-methyltransferase